VGVAARRIVFGVAAVACLGLAFGEKSLGRPVVIVRRAAGETEKTRGVLYASRDYAFQDGHHARLTGDGAGTLVVNDGAGPMRIESIHYGSIAVASDPEPVAPMSLHDAKYGIDYVGPDAPPPSEVQSNISFDIKYWLTWGGGAGALGSREM
jgi:hypothetical protein